MVSVCIRRLVGMGLAVGTVAALPLPAQGQILDFLRGRESRRPVVEERIERSYSPVEVMEQDQEEGREGAYRRGATRHNDGEFHGTARRYEARGGSGTRRGTALIGSTVRLEDGRSFGRIEDIVIGESGCVEFLVVSGLRGMSGKLAILPFQLGETDFSRRTVMLDWTEEDLRNAPIFFSANTWPDFSDTHWTGEVFAYFEMDTHGEHVGRAYREPRDSGRGFDERSRTTRDERGEFRDRESTERGGESDRARGSRTRSRDSSSDRQRGDTRSRARDDDMDEDRAEPGDRSTRPTESRERGSDRNRSSQRGDRENHRQHESDDKDESRSGSKRDRANEQDDSDSKNLPD